MKEDALFSAWQTRCNWAGSGQVKGHVQRRPLRDRNPGRTLCLRVAQSVRLNLVWSICYVATISPA